MRFAVKRKRRVFWPGIGSVLKIMAAEVSGKKIRIETFKDVKGKFGRYLAVLYIDNKNINDELVKNNHAIYVNY